MLENYEKNNTLQLYHKIQQSSSRTLMSWQQLILHIDID